MGLEKIKGYLKLEKWQQDLFESVYKSHMACVGNKDNWIVKSISWEKTYLKVSFKNGEWLHYTKSGTWY